MTAIDASAVEDSPAPDAPTPRPRRRGLRLPGSRQGMAWLVVLLIVGALLAVQFGRQVYANWEIGQRAASIQAQIDQVEFENEQLERELAYLRSDAFIGAEARRLANLGEPGERVLIIPPGAEQPLPEELAALPEPKPFLEQWVDLFFGPAG
jgi:cell division protein FtsB